MVAHGLLIHKETITEHKSIHITCKAMLISDWSLWRWKRLKDWETMVACSVWCVFKGVMTWPKVSSLVFRFWRLQRTNGPNPQAEWKLRYSPIQCAYLRALGDALFRPLMQQNWPRDKSCWCLHWFFGLRTDVWKILLHVYTRAIVTQVWIEKMFNKNKEIGFQSAVFHLFQRALVALLCNDIGPNATASI